MVLDAKVGVNRRPAAPGASASRRRSAEDGNGTVAARSSEQAAFRINIKDLRFLKSVGIDPTRKVRTRTPLPRRGGAARHRRAAR